MRLAGCSHVLADDLRYRSPFESSLVRQRVICGDLFAHEHHVKSPDKALHDDAKRATRVISVGEDYFIEVPTMTSEARFGKITIKPREWHCMLILREGFLLGCETFSRTVLRGYLANHVAGEMPRIATHGMDSVIAERLLLRDKGLIVAFRDRYEFDLEERPEGAGMHPPRMDADGKQVMEYCITMRSYIGSAPDPGVTGGDQKCTHVTAQS